MAVELRMPKLGMTMKKGIVAKWLKTEGEAVTKGEPVVEVMTEKITAQIESPAVGVLAIIQVLEKQEVPVGTTLALVAAVGEQVSVPEKVTQPALAAVVSSTTTAAGVAVDEDGRVKASPAAKRLAKEHGIDLSSVMASGADGRISSDDVLAYVAAQKEKVEPEKTINASDAAQRLALRNGVDLADVAQGLSNKQRITTEDVQAFLEIGKSPLTDRPKSIPLVGVRKLIADHLVESLRIGAQLTVSNETDATELVNAREILLPGFQVATGVRLTYTDMLIALVAKALQENPLLNSTLIDDEILLHDDVNVGIAVAIEGGLIVPAIHRAQTKSLAEISRARSDLARRAAEGRLSYEDIQGGTFTISNPGGVSSDITTPILNSPQNAILGVGRIVKKPAIYRDEICIRHTFWLSVTFDHRAMDGAPVARFLDNLNTMLQEPLKHLRAPNA